MIPQAGLPAVPSDHIQTNIIMIMQYVALTMVAVIVLGALSGGKDMGDTIRRGLRALLLLVALLIVAYFLYESWPVILEWLESHT
jgi:hypothetical protein